MIDKKVFINYYLLLNVSSASKLEDIKKAYFKLAKIYHPDKNRGNRLAEKKFQQINRAWEVLKDPKKKKLFDLQLKAQEKSKQALNKSRFSQEDIRIEGRIDLEVSIQVSLEEACQSLWRKINYLKQVNGVKKKNSFEFQIPWGVKEETRLYFKGRGGAEGLEEFGDLYVKINFRRHKLFKVIKDSFDLILEHPVSIISSFQDKKLQTLSPYGAVEVNVKPPLVNQQTLKIKGFGLVKNSKGDKGDLFIKILIDYPLSAGVDIKEIMKTLSYEEQRQYVKELSQSSFVYPKVLKFQKKVQEIKVKYYSL